MYFITSRHALRIVLYQKNIMNKNKCNILRQNKLTMYMYFQGVFVHLSNIFSYKIVRILYFLRKQYNFSWLFAFYSHNICCMYFMTIILPNIWSTCVSNIFKKCVTIWKCSISLYQHWGLFKIKNYNLFTKKMLL